MVANATGCSSIYGGNLPSTPWSQNAAGQGPAWANSLFEDNAEFGLGMRLALDAQRDLAQMLVRELRAPIGEALATALLEAPQDTDEQIRQQRERVKELKAILPKLRSPEAGRLLAVADSLVVRSVWIVGGDGWAYDIGYGGLDHVLASGRNVNILVLDTEVYSNTGGQASKSTQRGAVAKFAAAGKSIGKKDLGMIAMAYGNVYVAQVAMGANPVQTVRTFQEAASWHGPSLIIAYSHCIAHGIDMTTGMSHQRDAVKSGYLTLYHYDPRLGMGGADQPLKLDSRKPTHAARAVHDEGGPLRDAGAVRPGAGEAADEGGAARRRRALAAVRADRGRAPRRDRGTARPRRRRAAGAPAAPATDQRQQARRGSVPRRQIMSVDLSHPLPRPRVAASDRGVGLAADRLDRQPQAAAGRRRRGRRAARRCSRSRSSTRRWPRTT